MVNVPIAIPKIIRQMANMSSRLSVERLAPPFDDDDNFNKLNLYFLLLLWALNMFMLSLGLTLLFPIGSTMLLFDRLLLVLLFFTLLRCNVVMVCMEFGFPKLTTTATVCDLFVGEVDDDIELVRSEGTWCWGLAKFDEFDGLFMMLE
jgi:hypothetical protein